MSTLVYPVVPQQLRRACLEAAALVVAAERALVQPWSKVPLAPIPPGVIPDDPADGAPAEVFLLGSYGSLITELRVTTESLLAVGQAAPSELWTASDAAAADSQLPNWRRSVERHIDSSVMGGSQVRLGALAALRHSILVQRDIAVSPASPRFEQPLKTLCSLVDELRLISRAPDGEL